MAKRAGGPPQTVKAQPQEGRTPIRIYFLPSIAADLTDNNDGDVKSYYMQTDHVPREGDLIELETAGEDLVVYSITHVLDKWPIDGAVRVAEIRVIVVPDREFQRALRDDEQESIFSADDDEDLDDDEDENDEDQPEGEKPSGLV